MLPCPPTSPYLPTTTFIYIQSPSIGPHIPDPTQTATSSQALHFGHVSTSIVVVNNWPLIFHVLLSRNFFLFSSPCSSLSFHEDQSKAATLVLDCPWDQLCECGPSSMSPSTVRLHRQITIVRYTVGYTLPRFTANIALVPMQSY